jgi:putative endopeptidase
LYLDGNYTPFVLQVLPDPIVPELNRLVVKGTSNYLPVSGYYDEDNEVGQALLAAQADKIRYLAIAVGESEEEATKIVEDSLAFDRMTIPYMMGTDEQMRLQNSDTLVPFEEFAAYSENIDFEKLIATLAGAVPEQVALWSEDFFKDIDKLVNEENLDMVKNWLKADYLCDNALYLSTDMLKENYATSSADTSEDEHTEDSCSHSADQRSPDLDESPGAVPDEVHEINPDADGDGEIDEEALQSITVATLKGLFQTEIGHYYTETYMDEEVAADIEQMFYDSIEEYKKRMQGNEWLQDETKEKAIEKLDKMFVAVGETEFVNPMTDGVTLKSSEEGGTLVDNMIALQNNFREKNFKLLNQKNEGIQRIGNSLLQTPAHVVNAAYLPEINGVVINAAILSPPLYDANASESENLGGIGTIIAHEISHGFDQMGSKRDADGNLTDWWTPADHKEFDARTQKMIALFDGQPYMGGVLNGTLTVTENTADAGGLSVAMSMLEKLENPNYEGFFETWAKAWAEASTEEIMQLHLQSSLHSPGKFRVNLQLANFEQFYDTYGIKEGDGMYIAPEDRVSIW